MEQKRFNLTAALAGMAARMGGLGNLMAGVPTPRYYTEPAGTVRHYFHPELRRVRKYIRLDPNILSTDRFKRETRAREVPVSRIIHIDGTSYPGSVLREIRAARGEGKPLSKMTECHGAYFAAEQINSQFHKWNEARITRQALKSAG